MRSIRRTLALGAAVALVAVGCGGAATPAPSGDPGAPTDAPSLAPASIGPGASASTAPGSTPSPFDLGNAALALEGIDSYRVNFTDGSDTWDTLVIRNPSPAQHLTITSGGATQEFIIIGAEGWIKDGAGPFVPGPTSMIQTLTSAFDPMLLLGTFNSFAIGAAEVGTEQKNGVQARHYRIDESTLPPTAEPIPAGAMIDIWVAGAGYLVALEVANFEGPGTQLSIQVTNINDPSNKVEPPG